MLPSLPLLAHDVGTALATALIGGVALVLAFQALRSALARRVV